MIAAGTAGCGPPTPPGRTAAWRDDIAYLAQKLPQVHVGGLDGVTRSQWNAAADQLEARVPRLNDSQIIQGLERIIALLHDDETYLDGGPVGPVYPMALQWIGSGLYVVGAPPGNPGCSAPGSSPSEATPSVRYSLPYAPLSTTRTKEYSPRLKLTT